MSTQGEYAQSQTDTVIAHREKEITTDTGNTHTHTDCDIHTPRFTGSSERGVSVTTTAGEITQSSEQRM